MRGLFGVMPGSMRVAARERTVLTTTFESFGLNKALLQALASENYTVPTPIQAQAIPDVMKGKDLLGIAPAAQVVHA